MNLDNLQRAACRKCLKRLHSQLRLMSLVPSGQTAHLRRARSTRRPSVSWSSRCKTRQMCICSSHRVVARASKGWPIAATLCKNPRPVTSPENVDCTRGKVSARLEHLCSVSLQGLGLAWLSHSERWHLALCADSVTSACKHADGGPLVVVLRSKETMIINVRSWKASLSGITRLQ